MRDIAIRPARTQAELHACVALQVQVWGFSDRDAVPFNQLHAAHEWGGQVLVAVDGTQVVGFCYGFAGKQRGRSVLCSHMLAVLPEYRGRKVGVELKLAQGRWALQNGYDLITWTYDPLEALNANLNIGRLGGIVRQYLVNHYGDMQDGINKGLPTDRMLLEWHLTRPTVQRVLAGDDSGFSGTSAEPEESAGSVEAICEIPASIQRIKATDPDLALRWRLRVREQLLAALDRGLTVTGFRWTDGTGSYLLTREEEDRHAH